MTLWLDMDPDDLKDFLNEDQWNKLQESLKAKGKVLVKGIPLIPEVNEARTQSDWSCPNMLRKRYGKRAKRRQRGR